jgi:hypothetical protein
MWILNSHKSFFHVSWLDQFDKSFILIAFVERLNKQFLKRIKKVGQSNFMKISFEVFQKRILQRAFSDRVHIATLILCVAVVYGRKRNVKHSCPTVGWSLCQRKGLLGSRWYSSIIIIKGITHFPDHSSQSELPTVFRHPGSEALELKWNFITREHAHNTHKSWTRSYYRLTHLQHLAHQRFSLFSSCVKVFPGLKCPQKKEEALTR